MRKLATGLALAVLSATSASAANQTFDVTFSANSFSSINFNPPPVDPVTGSFRITFDTSQTYLNDTADIQAKTLNIDISSLFSFTYSAAGVPGESAPDQLVVGGLQDGAAHVRFSPASNDFWLFIDNVSTNASFDQLGYSRNGDNQFFTTDQTGSIGVTPVTGGAARALDLGDDAARLRWPRPPRLSQDAQRQRLGVRRAAYGPIAQAGPFHAGRRALAHPHEKAAGDTDGRIVVMLSLTADGSGLSPCAHTNSDPTPAPQLLARFHAHFFLLGLLQPVSLGALGGTWVCA